MIGGFSISPWGKTAQSPLVWAYDCFPFGMLMPGRYISDTSDHCMIISRSNWTTEMADTCKPLATLESTAYLSGNSTISTSGLNIVMNAPEEGSWIQLTIEVEAGIDNSFSFDVPVLEGAEESGMQVMIMETRDNTPYVIGGGYLMPGGRKQTISFNASGNTVNLLFNGPFSTAEIEQICTHYTKTTQQTYLVEVCNESKDKYRFGFNGMEKDNELKGIGNSLDFGARIYDSRVARWLSLDPLAQKYPSLSPYNFVGNSPIRFIDPDGKKIIIKPGTPKEEKAELQTSIDILRLINPERYNTMENTEHIFEVSYSDLSSYNVNLPNGGFSIREGLTRTDFDGGGVEILYDRDKTTKALIGIKSITRGQTQAEFKEYINSEEFKSSGVVPKVNIQTTVEELKSKKIISVIGETKIMISNELKGTKKNPIRYRTEVMGHEFGHAEYEFIHPIEACIGYMTEQEEPPKDGTGHGRFNPSGSAANDAGEETRKGFKKAYKTYEKSTKTTSASE